MLSYAVIDVLQKRLDKTLDLLTKATHKDNETYIRAAEMACTAMESSFSVMKAICESNGVDPAIVTRFAEANMPIVNARLRVVREIFNENESVRLAMFSAGKDIIKKLIDVKHSQSQVEPADAVGQAQLLAQQGMFPAANQPVQQLPQVQAAHAPAVNAPNL